MPTNRDARAITRREGLIAAALTLPVGLIAACNNSADSAPTSDSTASAAGSSAVVDANTLTQEVGADESALIALYDAALSAVPNTDARHTVLAGIREQHVSHLDALGVPPTTGGASNPLPIDPAALLTALARAENAAARSRIRACEAAPDAALARLLVFIAASESSHGAELRRSQP